MRLKRLLLVLLLFCQSLISGALAGTPYQEIYLKNYSGSDGLPGSQVNYLMQDSKGFIWIATDKGVSRFDGQHFKNFTSADGLESNEAFRIAEDNYHRIFFYCDNYKVCYYEAGRIHKLGSNQKVSVSPFASLFFNRYNELCVNYGLSSKIYNFLELKTKAHQASNTGRIIYGDQGEELALSANDTAVLNTELWAENFNAQTAYLNTKPYRLVVQQNYLLLITKDWIHVYQYLKTGIKPLKKITYSGDVNSVYLVGNHTIAVTTVKKGTYIINYITGGRKNYLNNHITTATLIDHENNLWFGTYDSGFYLSTNPGVQVINRETGLVNENVLKLNIAGGYLFTGHILTGLSYIKLNDTSSLSVGSMFINQNRSDFNRITNLVAITGNKLMIGTDNGIFSLDVSNSNPASWHTTQYDDGPIKDIVQHQDTVFYLNHKSLYTLSNQFKQHNHYDFAPIRITSLAWQKNKLLIGSFYGLYQVVYPIDKGNFKYVPILAHKGIKVVKCLASNGKVCAVGTEDKGVFLLNDQAISQFNAPVISSGNIRKLVWTDVNTLWVCTPNGANIIRFSNSYKTYRVSQLNTSNGLPSDNVADVVRNNDCYYIATDKGIAITPHLQYAGLPKPVLIADSIAGQKNSYTYGKPIIFNCLALSYKSMGKIQYRFRLKGVDKNWDIAPSGEKRFDLLPPGNYELEAVAADRFNQLSQRIVFRFKVVPLWYQQQWLQILATMSALFIGFFLIRKYYQSIIGLQKKDFENALALQQERQRISSEVHDDLGASISGIKLQTEMLSRKVASQPVFKEIDAIHNAITDISVQMRLIIWSLDTENDGIDSLAMFIRKQAVKLFENSGITLHENIDDSETNIIINGEKRRQVYLLVKEALNNIIKHAEAQNAYIDIKLYKRKLYITVRDDGRGFASEIKNNDTMGIRNIYARAKKLNAELKIDTTAGKGTAITLKMPL